MTFVSKSVQSLADLTQFGINALTGEACAYSLRVLCDVNEEGAQLLAEYFGIPDLQLANNWNSQVNGSPAVGSIMLTRSSVEDLATFAFFRKGALAVLITSDKSYQGVFDAVHLAKYEEYIANSTSTSLMGIALRRNPAVHSTAPFVGSRNIHAATGRVY